MANLILVPIVGGIGIVAMGGEIAYRSLYSLSKVGFEGRGPCLRRVVVVLSLAHARPHTCASHLSPVTLPPHTGYEWAHSETQWDRIEWVSRPLTAVASVVLFRGLNRVFRRVVLTPTNLRRRDRATLLRFQRAPPPPLTPSRVWLLLGPRATRLTVGQFRRDYGHDVVVGALAAMWALFFTALLQPALETPFVWRGEGEAAERLRRRRTLDHEEHVRVRQGQLDSRIGHGER